MEILTELSNLRKEMQKEFKEFPKGYCRESSTRAIRFGLEQTCGLFIDDDGVGHDHHWSKKDGKIYDITAIQFSDKLPEIYVLYENSDEAKSRYYEGIYLMI